MVSKQSFPSHWLRKLWLLPLSFGAALLTHVPVRAADTIYFQFGPARQPLQVRSLERFAESGEVPPDLRFFFNFLKVDEQRQQQLRRVLTQPFNAVNQVQLSRFFYTAMGQDFLKQLGSYIRTEAGNNGDRAMRAAILLAAGQKDGLTLLNVLREYPTNIRVDVQASLDLSRAAGIVVNATEFFTKALIQLSNAEAETATPADFSKLTDLTKPGPYSVQQQRWQLRDTSRDRSFYVEVWQPQQPRSGSVPVLILSHGLASNPEDFGNRARYLASYGFLVAAPQHPGSDTIHAQDVLSGLARDIFLLRSFIDRPRDVSFLLDELERRNPTEFGGRLNLKSVGVMGHSFGGYTALALAGATIDFDHLQQSCNNNLEYLDISLFLQCRALALPRQPYDFRDPRVAAVYAMNPVNNSIFGPEGLAKIRIPVMLQAGTEDDITPAIFEQVRSFDMLSTPDKYLAILEGGTHVNRANLDAQLSGLVESVSALTLAPPQILNTYSDALSLAFFEVFVQQNASFRPFLQSSYTQYLSRNQQFGVFLISNQSSEGLKRYSQEFRSKL